MQELVLCLGLMFLVLRKMPEKIRVFIEKNKYTKELINCPFCLAFWYGLIQSILTLGFTDVFYSIYQGFFYGIVSFFFFILLMLIESNIKE